MENVLDKQTNNLRSIKKLNIKKRIGITKYSYSSYY